MCTVVGFEHEYPPHGFMGHSSGVYGGVIGVYGGVISV